MLLALIGLAVTEIALWGRRQQARASTRAGYLDGVVSAARLAASGSTSPSDVVELVGRQIGDLLDLDACAFDPGPSHADRPRLEADGGITWRGRAVDVDREGLPTLDVIELPVTSAGVDRGRYLLTSTSAVRRPDLERRQVAVTLADQAAAALTGAAPLPHVPPSTMAWDVCTRPDRGGGHRTPVRPRPPRCCRTTARAPRTAMPPYPMSRNRSSSAAAVTFGASSSRGAFVGPLLATGPHTPRSALPEAAQS